MDCVSQRIKSTSSILSFMKKIMATVIRALPPANDYFKYHLTEKNGRVSWESGKGATIVRTVHHQIPSP